MKIQILIKISTFELEEETIEGLRKKLISGEYTRAIGEPISKTY
jgi:hypothetical protein